MHFIAISLYSVSAFNLHLIIYRIEFKIVIFPLIYLILIDLNYNVLFVYCSLFCVDQSPH